jgi:predicted acylesterase/phospholipase RssA
MRASRFAVALLVGAATIAGCTTTSRLPPPPPPLAARADPGAEAVRYLVARDASGLAQAERDAIRRRQAWRAAHGQTGPLPPANLLAISGGGDGGAFAAGLLNGWTAHGDRPEFVEVTGVSAGALIAPFAFLGPRYDAVLTRFYTQRSQRDIYHTRWLFPALFSDSLADTRPLRRLIHRYVDRRLLDAIAGEYAKGRTLFVGTTDLDTPEPVIWNMTAIAASKDPHAIDLFRRVLMASCAVPGVFPPVMIDVSVDGVRYQEMHVDGSTIAQVFAYPPNLSPGEVAASVGAPRQLRLYVIENVRLQPHWEDVKPRALTIADRAISTMTQAESVADLDRLYELAQRDHVDYNVALIPTSFDVPHKEPYDTAYMRSLYQTGYELGARGYRWRKAPPAYSGPLPPAPAQASQSERAPPKDAGRR